jgi:hypothetical protein
MLVGAVLVDKLTVAPVGLVEVDLAGMDVVMEQDQSRRRLLALQTQVGVAVVAAMAHSRQLAVREL